jgi:hypothetical protein
MWKFVQLIQQEYTSLDKPDLASISRNLQLRTQSEACAGSTSLLNRLLDAVHITVEIQRPLVQVACCHSRYHLRVVVVKASVNEQTGPVGSSPGQHSPFLPSQ